MSLLARTILPKDRPQIITTRVIAAPRALVWQALTTPEHLRHFWGPDGFTNTFTKYDLRVGGQALFTMHGPDGTDYPNRFIFITIDPPRLLAFDHDNGGEGPVEHKFRGELELHEEGAKTRVELRLIEASMEARDAVAQFALEGGRQNLDRLAVYVAPMVAAKNLFEIARTYPVSQERLFKACTEVDEIKQWMSPPGATILKVARDFKPGGTYHYGLAMPGGGEMWGLQKYLEITPSTRLVYLQSFADRQGNIAAHPMAPTWPKELVTVMEFIPLGTKQTKLNINWIYAGIDDAEAATFHAAYEGMTGGWTGTLDGLQSHLEKGGSQ